MLPYSGYFLQGLKFTKFSSCLSDSFVRTTTDGSTVILQDSAIRPPRLLSSRLPSAAISEVKMGPYLKLDDGMRANVHFCIHRLLVQLQHVLEETKK